MTLCASDIVLMFFAAAVVIHALIVHRPWRR
jgi:hypothetical protein